MTAVESLRIKNFAGIKDAHIELSRMNVFIGPQASGKSACAKLLFYFREIIRRTSVEVVEEHTKTQMRAIHRDLFLNYFPAPSWGKGFFEAEYSWGDLWIKVSRKDNNSSTVKLAYSDYYNTLLRIGRKEYAKMATDDARFNELLIHPLEAVRSAVAKQLAQNIGSTLNNQNYFVPAGRSFFSTIQTSVFSFIAGNVRIDPFIAEFGRLYENVKKTTGFSLFMDGWGYERFHQKVSSIICGTYTLENGSDYIHTPDGRKVAIENSSSGQQEALPLVLLLVRIGRTNRQVAGTTLFVEEPEAHLYPTAQREIVHLLAAVTDLASDETSGQYVITTHSPYILSALNNLMYGAQLAAQSPDKRSRIAQVLGDAALVPAENVRAYAFGEGQVQSIIDAETSLVRATVLDSVSNELAKEFGDLLDIEFEDEEMAA